MLIDKTHRPWIAIVLLATLVIAVGYWIARTHSTHAYFGASPVGLAYGIAALAIMIFASLLGARRKVISWRIGRGTTWMKAHLWLSLLLVPLVLFHSGLRMGGVFTQVIWWAFIGVTVTGILGVALQQFVPRLMTEAVPLETIYDQISHITDQLRYEADLLVAGVAGPLSVEIIPPEGIKLGKVKEGPAQEGSEALKAAYLQQMRPQLMEGARLHASLSTASGVSNFFNGLRIKLPPALHPAVERLEEIAEEKRQFERQRVLHAWLHAWLFIHVPLSVALLIMAIAHAVAALWY